MNHTISIFLDSDYFNFKLVFKVKMKTQGDIKDDKFIIRLINILSKPRTGLARRDTRTNERYYTFIT